MSGHQGAPVDGDGAGERAGLRERDRPRTELDQVAGGGAVLDGAVERAAAVVHPDGEAGVTRAVVAGRDPTRSGDPVHADVGFDGAEDRAGSDGEVGQVGGPDIVGVRAAGEGAGLHVDERTGAQGEGRDRAAPDDAAGPGLAQRPRAGEGGRGVVASGRGVELEHGAGLDHVGGRGIGALEHQASGADRRLSAIGVGAAEDQVARARLGQAVGRAADGAADGEGVGADGDQTAGAQRDGARTEVQGSGAGEDDVAVPVLGVVGRERQVRAAGAVDGAAGEGQRAGAEGGRAVDVQRAGVEDRAAGVGVVPGERQRAGARLGQAAGDGTEAGGEDDVGVRAVAHGIGSRGQGAVADRIAATCRGGDRHCAHGGGQAGQVDPATAQGECGIAAEGALAGEPEQAAVDDGGARIGVGAAEHQCPGARLGQAGGTTERSGDDDFAELVTHGIGDGRSQRTVSRGGDGRGAIRRGTGDGDRADRRGACADVEPAAGKGQRRGRGAERAASLDQEGAALDDRGPGVRVGRGDLQGARAPLGQPTRTGDALGAAEEVFQREAMVEDHRSRGDVRVGDGDDPRGGRVVETHRVTGDIIGDRGAGLGRKLPVAIEAGGPGHPAAAVSAGPGRDVGLDPQRDRLGDGVGQERGVGAGGRARDGAQHEASEVGSVERAIADEHVVVGDPGADRHVGDVERDRLAGGDLERAELKQAGGRAVGGDVDRAGAGEFQAADRERADCAHPDRVGRAVGDGQRADGAHAADGTLRQRDRDGEGRGAVQDEGGVRAIDGERAAAVDPGGAGQAQGAGVHDGRAGVGGGTAEFQHARAGFGESVGPADGAADGEAVGPDADLTVRTQRDGAGAEVQGPGAGEHHVGVPSLDVVGRQHDVGGAGVVEPAAVEHERAGAEGGRSVDVHRAGVERHPARVGVGASQRQRAGAVLGERARAGGEDARDGRVIRAVHGQAGAGARDGAGVREDDVTAPGDDAARGAQGDEAGVGRRRSPAVEQRAAPGDAGAAEGEGVGRSQGRAVEVQRRARGDADRAGRGPEGRDIGHPEGAGRDDGAAAVGVGAAEDQRAVASLGQRAGGRRRGAGEGQGGSRVDDLDRAVGRGREREGPVGGGGDAGIPERTAPQHEVGR